MSTPSSPKSFLLSENSLECGWGGGISLSPANYTLITLDHPLGMTVTAKISDKEIDIIADALHQYFVQALLLRFPSAGRHRTAALGAVQRYDRPAGMYIVKMEVTLCG